MSAGGGASPGCRLGGVMKNTDLSPSLNKRTTSATASFYQRLLKKADVHKKHR